MTRSPSTWRLTPDGQTGNGEHRVCGIHRRPLSLQAVCGGNTSGGIVVCRIDACHSYTRLKETDVTVNESDLDRLIRAGIAVTALGTGVAIGGIFNPIGIGLFGVAGMAAFTAASGYCPLYSLLGVSTCPVPQQD